MTLQPEQTAAQTWHNNLPMQFMWLTEPAQSIHTAHTVKAHTHLHTHKSASGVRADSPFKNTQSTVSYLQFGGGSKVISASSFWILKRDEDLCYIYTLKHTHTQNTDSYINPACKNQSVSVHTEYLIDFVMSSWALWLNTGISPVTQDQHGDARLNICLFFFFNRTRINWYWCHKAMSDEGIISDVSGQINLAADHGPVSPVTLSGGCREHFLTGHIKKRFNE